ncbi:MAG TPA: C4-dicarboxylate ABC transporter substrate-binding protein, partial [Proteiniclasticum sp.]|nr:C4-dicarboxylate ABC transporter substrate-binding protein [Proteiniclasticum sp.]
MNKKKILATLSSLVLVAFFAGCGLTSPETPETPEETPAETPAEGEEEPAEEPSSDMPEVTLVYAEVNPLETIVGQTDTAFKEKVEELSGGKITIDIQASGVLGSENDVLDTMLGGGGTIQMSRISAFALTSYGGEKSKLLSIP